MLLDACIEPTLCIIDRHAHEIADRSSFKSTEHAIQHQFCLYRLLTVTLAACGAVLKLLVDIGLDPQVVFGGAGAQGPLGDLWLFDLASRQWSQPDTKGEPPAAREMHTGTMIDETRMLIYGGRGPDGKVLLHDLQLSADVWASMINLLMTW